MPKPPTTPEFAMLERNIAETMRAGLKRWRPDLDYPESASDMSGCIRALLCMYEVKRRPLPIDLPVPCDVCQGTGYWSKLDGGIVHRNTCTECGGTGKDKKIVAQ